MVSNSEYPSSPEAEWRIALSRRFNHEWIDDLYVSVLNPILQEEGILLECSFASEDAGDIDFWMNRMSVVLELADVHVLVDIDKSAAVAYEMERSELIYRSRYPPALSSTYGIPNFDQRPFDKPLFSPSRVIIRKGARKPHQRGARTWVMYIPEKFQVSLCRDILREQLWKAKTSRLLAFRFVNSDRIGPFLVKLTDMAKIIQVEKNVACLAGEAKNYEILEDKYDSDLAGILVESQSWWILVKEGSAALPASLNETKALFFTRYQSPLQFMYSEKLTGNFFFRMALSIASFSTALYARYKQKKPSWSAPGGTFGGKESAVDVEEFCAGPSRNADGYRTPDGFQSILVVFSNERKQWWLHVREGSVELPASFKETKDLFLKNFQAMAEGMFSKSVAESFYFRMLLQLLSFVNAVYMRRIAGKLPRRSNRPGA